MEGWRGDWKRPIKQSSSQVPVWPLRARELYSTSYTCWFVWAQFEYGCRRVKVSTQTMVAAWPCRGAAAQPRCSASVRLGGAGGWGQPFCQVLYSGETQSFRLVALVIWPGFVSTLWSEKSFVSAQSGSFGERHKWVSPSCGVRGDVSSVCLMLIQLCLYCIMWISFLSCSNSEHFADLKPGASCYGAQCGSLMWLEPLGAMLKD